MIPRLTTARIESKFNLLRGKTSMNSWEMCQHFHLSSSSRIKLLSQLEPYFIWTSLVWGAKVCWNDSVCWLRWPLCPSIERNLLKILFSNTVEPGNKKFGIKHKGLRAYQISSNGAPRTFHGKVKFVSLYIDEGKT